MLDDPASDLGKRTKKSRDEIGTRELSRMVRKGNKV